MAIRGVQPLCDHGKQRDAFPARGVFRGPPPMPVLPFYKLAYHCVPSRSKMDPQAPPCFPLNFGYNHGSDCFKIVDAETGRVVHSRNVTWHQSREPIISLAPTLGSGVSLSSDAKTPDYVYIQPTPAATATPATAPATVAPVPASVVTVPAPTPTSNPPTPIPDRVVRELGHEADVRMPGRTRGKKRTMSTRAALAQYLATRGGFNEAFREHDLPKAEIDLPTAPASNIPTPSTVAETEASEHAEIWCGSRARKFSGL